MKSAAAAAENSTEQRRRTEQLSSLLNESRMKTGSVPQLVTIPNIHSRSSSREPNFVLVGVEENWNGTHNTVHSDMYGNPYKEKVLTVAVHTL